MYPLWICLHSSPYGRFFWICCECFLCLWCFDVGASPTHCKGISSYFLFLPLSALFGLANRLPNGLFLSFLCWSIVSKLISSLYWVCYIPVLPLFGFVRGFIVILHSWCYLKFIVCSSFFCFLLTVHRLNFGHHYIMNLIMLLGGIIPNAVFGDQVGGHY